MLIYRILPIIVLLWYVSAEYSTKELIQIHKAWLERRALLKGKIYNGSNNISSNNSITSNNEELVNNDNDNDNNDNQKTSYFRKIIKFKNNKSPISENDISFMRKQAFDDNLDKENSINSNNFIINNDNNHQTDVIKFIANNISDKITTMAPDLIITKSEHSFENAIDEKMTGNLTYYKGTDVGNESTNVINEKLTIENITYAPTTVTTTTTLATTATPILTSTEIEKSIGIKTSIDTNQLINTTVMTTKEINNNNVPPLKLSEKNLTNLINFKRRKGKGFLHLDKSNRNNNRIVAITSKNLTSLWSLHNRNKKIINNNNLTSATITTTTTVLPPTIENQIEHGHGVNDLEITTVETPIITTVAPIVSLAKIKSYWGTWTTWTNCSRTCGGGVMSQTRRCIARTSKRGEGNNQSGDSEDCIGLYKRYHICNEQSCPNPEEDFREQQCKQYNEKVFKGKRYDWEAYIKEDAECELNCKPVGLNYFATLNATVIDGTECTKPSESFRRNFNGRAICVEGVCKAVHSSGVITGSFMNSGAVRCGVLVCRPVSGIFTKNPLPNGYVHVATIPHGASNISITELKNSINFLVLKSPENKYIINGDYSVSASGIYKAAGTIFDYRRIDGLTNTSNIQGTPKNIDGVTEWITSIGPTTEPIHLMVLAKQSNPGIKYEYLLPVQSHASSTSEEDGKLDAFETTSSETEQTTQSSSIVTRHGLKSAPGQLNTTTRPAGTRKRKFLWKVIGFSPCSKSCGGGSQAPIVRCVREAPTRFFSPKRCAHLKQPTLNENLMRCNTQPCPAYWKLADWSECSCGNYNEEVFQQREAKCVQELGTGMVIQVNNAACMDEMPPIKQKCECMKQMKTPQLEVYKHKNPNNHHHHHQNNGVSHSDISAVRHNIHGIGRHHQNSQIAATGVIYSNSTHNKRAYADNKRSGTWLTSEWNEACSSSCGSGVQLRTIFCDRSPPNSERCDLRFTPDTARQCSSEKRCTSGDWFVGPWSHCSGDCFNLTKTRSILCVHQDTILNDDECKLSEKPTTQQSCALSEVKDCRPRWHFSEWTDCSKPCDGGTQKRVVKCFEPNLSETQMKESQNCRYAERPNAYTTCNIHACAEQTTTTTTTTTTTEVSLAYSEPRVDLVQNDIIPECKDDFTNCHLVVGARLCSYSYYMEHCCDACKVFRL